MYYVLHMYAVSVYMLTVPTALVKWGWGQGASPAPARLQQQQRAQVWPRAGRPGRVGGRAGGFGGCELPWVLSFQLQGNPGTSRVNPSFLPRSVCSSLCLAAPPWGVPPPGVRSPPCGHPTPYIHQPERPGPARGMGWTLSQRSLVGPLKCPNTFF